MMNTKELQDQFLKIVHPPARHLDEWRVKDALMNLHERIKRLEDTHLWLDQSHEISELNKQAREG